MGKNLPVTNISDYNPGGSTSREFSQIGLESSGIQNYSVIASPMMVEQRSVETNLEKQTKILVPQKTGIFRSSLHTTSTTAQMQKNQTDGINLASQYSSVAAKTNPVNLAFSQSSMPQNTNERQKFSQAFQGRSSSTARDPGLIDPSSQVKNDHTKISAISFNREFQPLFSSAQPVVKSVQNSVLKYQEKPGYQISGEISTQGQINPFLKQSSHPYIDEAGLQPMASSRQSGIQSYNKSEFTPGMQPIKKMGQIYSAPSHQNYITQRKNN